MAPRVWPVFVAYLVAVVTIILVSLVALGMLRVANPDVPDTELLSGATGLIAGGLASSIALVLTVLLVARPFEAAALRLRPGPEMGADLAAAIVGMLALGKRLPTGLPDPVDPPTPAFRQQNSPRLLRGGNA